MGGLGSDLNAQHQPTMNKKLILIALAVLALGATGCTSVKSPAGWEYRSSIFQKQIDTIELSGHTNGNYTLKVKGYRSDTSAMIESVAAGVAKGLNPAP
jgi:hypothetical protein